MATLVMQSLGCDVSALNTVHFSKLWMPIQSTVLTRLQAIIQDTDRSKAPKPQLKTSKKSMKV